MNTEKDTIRLRIEPSCERKDYYVLHIGKPEEGKMEASKKPIFVEKQRTGPAITIPIKKEAKEKSFLKPKKMPRSLTQEELERIKNLPTPKEFFLNLTKKALASLTIFTALFLLMNYQAYAQIFKRKIENITQTGQANVFEALEPAKSAAPEAVQLLPLYKNPEYARKKIADLSIGIAPPDTRLIIPRIEKNVPMVTVKTENLIKKNWEGLEKDIMNALRNGVIHYPGTAMPGQKGNIVVTGHSSYFPWDPGRFKDVFALLHEVKLKDKIYLFHNQKKYVYEVSDIKVVTPDQVDLLKQTEEDRLTLITCTPIGTNLKRLIVTAKLISVES